MRAIPSHVVLDASVLIKLFVPNVDSWQARDSISFLTTDSNTTIHVPSFLFVECANILWKYARFSNYPLSIARTRLMKLKALTLDVIQTEFIIDSAFETAYRYQISVYDACYVETANLHNAILLTADKRLVGRLSKSPFQIELLSDFANSIQ